jgi:nitrite reductase/ring-hydroxylating ferredoxin subunit
VSDHREPDVCARVVDRRAFLRQTAAAAGAVLVGLGAAPQLLGAEVREVAAEPAPPSKPVRQYIIPSTDGASVDVANEVLLVRWTGRLYAFDLACPHRGARLQWQGAGGVSCPKHKARFAADGAHVGGRRTRDLDRYAVRIIGSRVEVDLGTRLRADVNAAAWAAASVLAGRG